jgi:hypothetical protein
MRKVELNWSPPPPQQQQQTAQVSRAGRDVASWIWLVKMLMIDFAFNALLFRSMTEGGQNAK